MGNSYNMEIIISAAVSADGYIDDSSCERLVLSNKQDWAEVHELRAQCDAILIGAGTLRVDNPSLVTKSEELRQKRLDRGLAADPIKVVVSASAELNPQSRFFTTGHSPKVIITSVDKDNISNNYGPLTSIITLGSPISAPQIISALNDMGVKRLMVEGGAQMLKLFVDSGYVDYMRLAIAPFFVADTKAVRFLSDGVESFTKENRMSLISVEKLDDMIVAKYDTRSEDRKYLMQTIELANLCPSSDTAYSVGALIVTRDGQIFEGYSRKTSDINHAEEEAILAAQQAGAQLEGATIYSSMEPCSTRSSKPR